MGPPLPSLPFPSPPFPFLSFYPNLLYILHTVFLFLRLSLSDSADRSLPSFHYLLHILLQLCQSLNMSFFRPWFARPCKLEIPWWLSCRWLLASSSLLALVHFSLLHPVCEVLSHFTSLNPLISFSNILLMQCPICFPFPFPTALWESHP